MPAHASDASGVLQIEQWTFARAIENHAPAGTEAPFTTADERVYLYLAARNRGAAPAVLIVTFTRPNGQVLGTPARLDVNAVRSVWHTWAFARVQRLVGTWDRMTSARGYHGRAAHASPKSPKRSLGALGEAVVGEDRAPVGAQEHVAGLEVAVHPAPGVRVREALARMRRLRGERHDRGSLVRAFIDRSEVYSAPVRWSERFSLALTLVALVASPSVISAQTSRFEVTWRLIENRSESGDLASRFEVTVRDPAGRVARFGPFAWRCYVSYENGRLGCVYGGAFDYLRVRHRDGICLFEAQRSTEHGMYPTRSLGRAPCAGTVVAWVENGPGARTRQPLVIE